MLFEISLNPGQPFNKPAGFALALKLLLSSQIFGAWLAVCLIAGTTGLCLASKTIALLSLAYLGDRIAPELRSISFQQDVPVQIMGLTDEEKAIDCGCIIITTRREWCNRKSR